MPHAFSIPRHQTSIDVEYKRLRIIRRCAERPACRTKLPADLHVARAKRRNVHHHLKTLEISMCLPWSSEAVPLFRWDRTRTQGYPYIRIAGSLRGTWYIIICRWILRIIGKKDFYVTIYFIKSAQPLRCTDSNVKNIFTLTDIKGALPSLNLLSSPDYDGKRIIYYRMSIWRLIATSQIFARAVGNWNLLLQL